MRKLLHRMRLGEVSSQVERDGLDVTSYIADDDKSEFSLFTPTDEKTADSDGPRSGENVLQMLFNRFDTQYPGWKKPGDLSLVSRLCYGGKGKPEYSCDLEGVNL